MAEPSPNKLICKIDHIDLEPETDGLYTVTIRYVKMCEIGRFDIVVNEINGLNGSIKIMSDQVTKTDKKGKKNKKLQTSPLYEKLRELRTEIAKREGVGRFMIFHDSTLLEMDIRKPKDMNQLLSIKGIGEIKCKKYGRAFLCIINHQDMENAMKEYENKETEKDAKIKRKHVKKRINTEAKETDSDNSDKKGTKKETKEYNGTFRDWLTKANKENLIKRIEEEEKETNGRISIEAFAHWCIDDGYEYPDMADLRTELILMFGTAETEQITRENRPKEPPKSGPHIMWDRHYLHRAVHSKKTMVTVQPKKGTKKIYYYLSTKLISVLKG